MARTKTKHDTKLCEIGACSRKALPDNIVCAEHMVEVLRSVPGTDKGLVRVLIELIGAVGVGVLGNIVYEALVHMLGFHLAEKNRDNNLWLVIRELFERGMAAAKSGNGEDLIAVFERLPARAQKHLLKSILKELAHEGDVVSVGNRTREALWSAEDEKGL